MNGRPSSYRPVAKASSGVLSGAGSYRRPAAIPVPENEEDELPVDESEEVALEEQANDAGGEEQEIDPWAALEDDVPEGEIEEAALDEEGNFIVDEEELPVEPEEEEVDLGGGELDFEEPAEASSSAPLREDDLDVADVPEEMREAVEGSMKLKRMLSSSADSAAKKRKTSEVAAKPLEPEKQELLDRWRLSNDHAVRYVLQASELEDVMIVSKTNWRPAPNARAGNGNPKSFAEQVNERMLQARESHLPPRDAVDTIKAFRYRWSLSGEDETILRGLNHKDLRYVMTEHNGSRSIAELVEEAAMQLPSEERERAVDAAPEKHGLLTVSRFNRLELIDPNADALVVGDANLTFSALLAQHRESLGHVGRIVATTFETIEILRGRYSEIDETVAQLEEKNAEVLHNVDGTRLAVDPRFQEMANKFGAVYYNFPHAGVVQGFFDGHPFVRWRHENLMHLFFRALRGFVKTGGIVKVASNSCATGVRYSDIITAAQNSEFVHIETIPFIEWQLRNYLRSYGDRRDAGRRPGDGEIYRNQRVHSDMVYAFRYEPSGENPPKPLIRHPPTKDDLLLSAEGKLRELQPAAKSRKVEEIYDLFLTYVQGIHVG